LNPPGAYEAAGPPVVNASIARRLRGSRGARQQLETPVDLLVVSSANPEDYANRGNLITPPRDRIGS
jgi:hypothetical protein